MPDSTPDPKALLEGTTPGPWGIEGSYIMDRYRSQIITLLGDMAEAYPEAEADARLIAAAPDLAARLVEAERLLRSSQDSTMSFDQWRHEVRAFLAPLVDGEQPHE